MQVLDPKPDYSLYFNSKSVFGCGLSVIGMDHKIHRVPRQDHFTFFLDDNIFGFALADGLTSHKDSHLGAKMICDHIQKNARSIFNEFLKCNQQSNSISNLVFQIIHNIRQEIDASYQIYNAYGNAIENCGSTIIAFLSNGRQFLSFNIGDGLSTIASNEDLPRLLNPGRRIRGTGVAHIFSSDLTGHMFFEYGTLPPIGYAFSASDGMDCFLLDKKGEFDPRRITPITKPVMESRQYKYRSISRLENTFIAGDIAAKDNPKIDMSDDRTMLVLSWNFGEIPDQNQIPESLKNDALPDQNVNDARPNTEKKIVTDGSFLRKVISFIRKE